MVSIHVLATPISGLRRSSSVKPMALNMERAPARSRPSVMPRLRCLRSMGEDYNMSYRFEIVLRNELSSRAQRATLVLARGGKIDYAGRNHDPSPSEGDNLVSKT